MESQRMHHQDYHARSNSRGDGRGRRPVARGIAPTAMPSLSTGQGYYTVESLQGATVVPPPQIAPPPPPRLLPPPERYPDERAYGSRHFDSRGGPLVPMGRKFLHISPPPRGGGGRDRGFMMPHPPPPFMGDPRMLGFHPGIRDPIPGRQRAWGPPPDFDRRRMDVSRRDQNRPRQRPKAKKQAQKKPVSEAKTPGSAAADTKSPAQKEDLTEGGPGWCSVCQINCCTAETLEKHLAGKRHKRQLESEKEGEKVNNGDGQAIKVDQEDQVITEVENVDMVTEGTANVGEAAEQVTDVGVSEAAEMMVEAAEQVTDVGVSEAAEMMVDAGVSEAAEMMLDAGVSEAVETTVDARVSEAAEMIVAAGVSETAVTTGHAGESETAVMIVDAEVGKTAVVTVSETAVVTVSETAVKDVIGVGEAAEITVNAVATEATVNAVVTEAAEKTDGAGATKAVEKTDTVAKKSAEKLVEVEGNEVAKEKSEQVGAANTPLDGMPLVGKKRGAQEEGATSTSKKPRKPASSPGAAQNIAAEGAKVKNEAFREVCELCHVTCTSKAMLENHLKTKKHATNLKKSSGSPSVRGKKDQSKGSGEGGEESSERVKEDLEGVEGGAKELSDIGDLGNGKAGQSAEIQ